MGELYACWSWFRRFTGASLVLHHDYSVTDANAVAGVTTFFVVACGAFGCILGGVCGDRLGRCLTSAVMSCASFVCSLVAGHTATAPSWVLVTIGILWGVFVIGDSAQYSAMVTEVTAPDIVGTAVTLQQAIGYAITCATVFLVPVWEA